MNAYFDTSALVKLLLVAEPGTELATDMWERAGTVFSSRATYVEARAALSAAARTGRLRPPDRSEARRGLDERFRAIDIVELSPALAQTAADLADEHALRGYDAIQLASSLAIDSGDTVMVTWDRELALAAYASGLDVAGVEIEVS